MKVWFIQSDFISLTFLFSPFLHKNILDLVPFEHEAKKVRVAKEVKQICKNAWHMSLNRSKDGSSVRWDLRPQLRSFLSNRASNSAALSFSLVVHNDSCVILTVKEGSVRSVPSSSLSYYNSGVHFLSEFLDSLLDRAEHYVADGTGG